MYNYSPLEKLYIKNFRNIGEVEIDFTESPIVTLVGENEAGKTSVIKAFATCALHANPREQKDCIRDNTKMFGVAIDLKDGTRIVRIKEASGVNAYQIFDKDKNLIWNTNKITDGLPEEVHRIMGLIAEPETNEFLHIRTYEDKLLFVVTPNSTNYKVMYNALKVEQLTKAIKLGNNEVNSIKSQINTNEISLNTLQSQARNINIVDTEPLTNVKNRLIEQMTVLNKLERAKSLIDNINKLEEQMGAMLLIDKFKLDTINELTASKLTSVGKILDRINDKTKLSKVLEQANSISEIDTSILNKLINIINRKEMLDRKIKDAGSLVHLSEISEISEIEIVQLNKALALLAKIETNKKMIEAIDTTGSSEVSDIDIKAVNTMQRVEYLIAENERKKSELDKINNYIEQVHNYMKQCGVAVETCPKCGESVVFDIDKLEA